MPEIRFQLGEGTPLPAPNFTGLIVAGEPEAALVAKNLLLSKGNAADAAAALGLTLSVTLPSRAGLGANGLCLLRDGATRSVEVLTFEAAAEALSALHARFGRLPWGQVAAPAEQRARFGVTVSRALARDTAAHGAVLIDDRETFRLFTTPERRLIAAGDLLRQPALADTLSELRARGPQSMRLTARWSAPLKQGDVYLLPARESGTVPPAAATTSFAVADADGLAVSCVLTLGRPFGQGRIGANGSFAAAPASLEGTDAAMVMNADTGELRAASIGNRAAVRRFVDTVAKGRREDLPAALAGADVVPTAAWACPNGLRTDGRGCDVYPETGAAGYALIVVPEP